MQSSSSLSNRKSGDEAIHISSDTDSDSSPSEEEQEEENEAEILSIMKSVKSSSKPTSTNSMDPIESNTESSDSANSKSSSNQSNELSNKSNSNQSNNSSNKSRVDVGKNESKTDSNIDEPTDPLNQAQISLMTEDGSMNVDEVSQQATNPLDQAQMSVLTDDTSTMVEERNVGEKLEMISSVMVETVSKTGKKDETEEPKTVEIAGISKQSQNPKELITKISKDKAVVENPLAQVSLMTEDTDASDQEFSLKYSDDEIQDNEKKSEIAGKMFLFCSRTRSGYSTDFKNSRRFYILLWCLVGRLPYIYLRY